MLRCMLVAVLQIHWWHWGSFVLLVLLFLALDLGLLHRRAREIRFKEALAWTLFLVLMALVFAATLAKKTGADGSTPSRPKWCSGTQTEFSPISSAWRHWAITSSSNRLGSLRPEPYAGGLSVNVK